MPTIQVQPPFTTAELHILRDADWNDCIPPILDAGEPMVITDEQLELWILPTLDHDELCFKIASDGASPAIDFQNDPETGSTIFVPRDTVRANLPIKRTGNWKFFLLLKEPDGAGFLYSEVLRGPCFIHDGNVEAT